MADDHLLGGAFKVCVFIRAKMSFGYNIRFVVCVDE
jgi:hypothetical protein